MPPGGHWNVYDDQLPHYRFRDGDGDWNWIVRRTDQLEQMKVALRMHAASQFFPRTSLLARQSVLFETRHTAAMRHTR